MKDSLRKFLVTPDASLLQTMRAIDEGAKRIALVVDSEGSLLATITDGDIRRGILRGLSLESPVREVMQSKPTCIRASEGSAAALRLMRKLSIHHIPIVDDHGRLVDLEWADSLIGLEHRDTWIVLMAGGKGVRLMPLTERIPKPMVPIGGRPLLETVIRNFTNQGFRKFFIAVNHRREVVQDYFADGGQFDAEIEYLIESEPLGTAGALSLLPERPTNPFIVMNSDVLTSMRFEKLVRFHVDSEVTATMCVRQYTSQVPYGVVRTLGDTLVEIQEKPTQEHFVSAGIYALSPCILDLLRADQRTDMPQIFGELLAGAKKPAVFPVSDYWMDIGRAHDLDQARDDFDEVFGK